MKQRSAILCVLVVLGVAVPSVDAKPKPATRNYSVSCEKLWPAARAAVGEHYDVLNLNEQERAGSFTTGSVWSGIRPLAFSLTGKGDECTVSVTGHFSGLIHNDKGDFFNRIQKALDNGAIKPTGGDQ